MECSRAASSRWDFIKSKVATIVLLSLASTLFVFLIGLVTGLIYSPYQEVDEIFEYIVFIPAYFLELMGFMVFTMFVTILIRKSVLTMGVLFLYTCLEYKQLSDWGSAVWLSAVCLLRC